MLIPSNLAKLSIKVTFRIIKRMKLNEFRKHQVIEWNTNIQIFVQMCTNAARSKWSVFLLRNCGFRIFAMQFFEVFFFYLSSSSPCILVCERRRFGIIIYTFANVHTCARLPLHHIAACARHMNAESKHLQCDSSYLFSLHCFIFNFFVERASEWNNRMKQNANPDLQLIFTIILH